MVAIPALRQLTIEAIDQAVVAQNNTRFNHTIGGSTIGHKCERHLWYRFRWACPPEQYDGRMLRLFETGHLEEARMIAWLEMAGVHVEAVDPETGRQWQVKAVNCHFKGYADAIVQGLKEAPSTRHLLECKTHALKSFKQVQEVGVAEAKPDHVAQMQIYMHLLGLTRAFYLAKCKDNDTLYGERIDYDPAHAAALVAKAERIVEANEAPARISDKPDYFLCKSYKCPFYDLCHKGAFALRNCRTCLHSSPINDGQWYCQRHERELSICDQNAGCPSHLYLPSLIHGEQVDADEAAETVSYKMTDGTLWSDGNANEATK